jgi:hypothetical protein
VKNPKSWDFTPFSQKSTNVSEENSVSVFRDEEESSILVTEKTI